MARREQFEMTVAQSQQGRFSDGNKKEKVRDIELGLIKISEVCKEYEVSQTSVYRWIDKFGVEGNSKPERLIVESKSDTKKLIKLRKKIAELERLVGQKQIVIDFQEKMIDLAEQQYGVDIKKKHSGRPSNITGKNQKK